MHVELVKSWWLSLLELCKDVPTITVEQLFEFLELTNGVQRVHIVPELLQNTKPVLRALENWLNI